MTDKPLSQPNDELVAELINELPAIRATWRLSKLFPSEGDIAGKDVNNLLQLVDALMEENKRLTYFNDHYKHDAELMKGQRDRLRDELEQLREDRHQNAADMFHDLNTELVQVKAERDKWKDSAHYWSNAYHALPILAKLKGEDKT